MSNTVKDKLRAGRRRGANEGKGVRELFHFLLVLKSPEIFLFLPWVLELFDVEANRGDDFWTLRLSDTPQTRKTENRWWQKVSTSGEHEQQPCPLPGWHVSTPLKRDLSDWTAENRRSVTDQEHLRPTIHHDILTLGGFSWLMMVVLPLLSSPRHKRLTSFFLRPSQVDSLSSSPIGHHGLDTAAVSPHRWAHELLSNMRDVLISQDAAPDAAADGVFSRSSCERSHRLGRPALWQVILLGWFNLCGSTWWPNRRERIFLA